MTTKEIPKTKKQVLWSSSDFEFLSGISLEDLEDLVASWKETAAAKGAISSEFEVHYDWDYSTASLVIERPLTASEKEAEAEAAKIRKKIAAVERARKAKIKKLKAQIAELEKDDV